MPELLVLAFFCILMNKNASTVSLAFFFDFYHTKDSFFASFIYKNVRTCQFQQFFAFFIYKNAGIVSFSIFFCILTNKNASTVSQAFFF